MKQTQHWLHENSFEEDFDWSAEAKRNESERTILEMSAHVAHQVLTELRARGMSQKELAKLMGVSAQRVSKMLQGEANITLVTIAKIKDALGISVTLEAPVAVPTVHMQPKMVISSMVFENYGLLVTNETSIADRKDALCKQVDERHKLSYQDQKPVSSPLTDELPI